MRNISKTNSRSLGLREHYRPRQCAAIWQQAPPHWRDELARALKRGMGGHVPPFFFRADDIGAGGQAFEAMCRLFRHHEVPLALSVVPAWLSVARQEQLFQCAPLEESLWGWHQHGWRHVNWQRAGKKCEFGEQRPIEKQWRDIWQGQQKMLEIFGEYTVPVFTPPWNRLSAATVRILHELGFTAVSMAGPLPRGQRQPHILKNLRIQMDLHTRKAKDSSIDFQNLLEELNSLLTKKDPVGIMIHHHRMTPFAFEFLHELIILLKDLVGVRFLSFKEMLEIENEE